MSQNGIKIKDKTIVEQMASIKTRYPSFNVVFNRLSLKSVGTIKPTPRSETYIVEIKYKLHFPVKVSILQPTLLKNFNGDDVPHVYPGKKLCLFYPKYMEFKQCDFISDTIIPWTSLWLYYYEDWHMTGEWHGGGIHPE